MICFAAIVAGKSQNPTYSRTLETTIVSADHFEESRLQLMHLTDSLHCLLISLSEEKDGSKPALFDAEFYTDEQGYQFIDRTLALLGHVAYKKAGLSLLTATSDTLLLRQKLDENRKSIEALEQRLSSGEGDCMELLNLLEQLKSERSELELQMQRAWLLSSHPHHVVIHLRN